MFSQLNQNQLLKQIFDSMKYLQNNFSVSNKAFSFPFTDDTLDKSIFNEIYNQGIEITFGTAGIKKDVISKNVQRIPVEKYSTSGKSILLQQQMLYFVKMLLQKHIVRRL